MKIGVTGGRGMLGSAVVRQAVERGHEVAAIDKDAAGPDSSAPSEHRVADMRDREALTAALDGVDAVIHTASLVDLHLGQPARLFDTNVTGVENLIAACQARHISRLVHMSSAEVITGATPLRGVTEAQASYPQEHLTYYGETKQAGEELVLAAATPELGTCAMRTYGIFGEGDNTVLPLYLSKLVMNTSMFIGDLSARTDTVYAGNLAHALVLAAEQLDPTAPWSGMAFHVTDHEPVNVQRFLAELLEPVGIRSIERVRLPQSVASVVARVSEALFARTNAERFAYPSLTSHALRLAVDDYWLDSTNIRETLGYAPPFARQQAIDRTQDWLKTGAFLGGPG